jgi:argininosuccinate synthase
MKRILLGYTGGANGSAAIAALAARPGAEVITLTIDIGQSRELTSIKQRALASGAARAHVIDAREIFAADYIWPVVQAGVSRTERFAAALAMPLLARKLIEVARIEQADAVAHGATGRDADIFDRILATMAPGLPVIRAHSGAAGTTAATPEPNLWARPIGDDTAPFRDDSSDFPAVAATLDIEFDDGIPVRLNGVDMPLIELIESLETIAGAHRIGQRRRLLLAVTTEAPAPIVLEDAYAACKRSVFDRDVLALQSAMTLAYERLITDGDWGRPQHDALAAFVAALQPRVRGHVRMELHRGNCRVIAAGAEGTLAPAAHGVL